MGRTAYLHPLIITVLLVSPLAFLFVLDAATVEPGFLISQAALSLLIFPSMATHLAWAWSMYKQSSAQVPQTRQRFRWASLVFAGVATAWIVLGLLSLFVPGVIGASQDSGDVLLAAGVLNVLGACSVFGLLTCNWYATKALFAAEAARSLPQYSELKTFVLMFYLFLGVWFLRPRLIALGYRS